MPPRTPISECKGFCLPLDREVDQILADDIKYDIAQTKCSKQGQEQTYEPQDTSKVETKCDAVNDSFITETRWVGGSSNRPIPEKSACLGTLDRNMESDIAACIAKLNEHRNYIASFLAESSEQNVKLESGHDECMAPNQYLQKLDATTLTKHMPGPSYSEGGDHGLQREELVRCVNSSEVNGRPAKERNGIRNRASSLTRLMHRQAIPSVGCSDVSQKDISGSSGKSRGQFEFDVEVQGRQHISELKHSPSPLNVAMHQRLSREIKDCHGQSKTEHVEQSAKHSREQTCKPMQNIFNVETKCAASKGALGKGTGLIDRTPSRSSSEERSRQMCELQQSVGKMMEKRSACRTLLMTQSVKRSH